MILSLVSMSFGLLRGIINCLAEVHRARIIHDDLHVGNLLVNGAGQVFLADFERAVGPVIDDMSGAEHNTASLGDVLHEAFETMLECMPSDAHPSQAMQTAIWSCIVRATGPSDRRFKSGIEMSDFFELQVASASKVTDY